MKCPFSDLVPFTTWVDVKERVWMLVNIDYWGLHENKQEHPQRVILRRVGSISEINITAASMIEEIGKQNMRQVIEPVKVKFKAA